MARSSRLQHSRVMTAGRTGVRVAVIVWILGFGMLALLSVARLGDDRLPGLFTFRSATVGDGLLLPVLAGTTVAAGRWRAGWSRSERRCLAVAAIAGLLAGAGTQVQWLLDPRPRLNWTLPAPHHFAIAGWYHAVFLTLASGFFLSAGTGLWLRLRHEARSTPGPAIRRVRSVAVLGVLVPVSAFVALLAQDNGATLGQAGGLAAAALLVVVAATGAAAGPRVVPVMAVAAGLAILPTISLACLLTPRPTVTPLTVVPAVVAGLAGASATAVLRIGARWEHVVVASCAALAAAGPVYLAATLERLPALPALLACALSSVMATLEVSLFARLLTGSRPAGRWLLAGPGTVAPIVVVGMAGRYLHQEADLAAAWGNIAVALSGLLLLAVAARGVRMHFAAVISAEEADAPRSHLSATKWQAYLAIVTAYAAALLASISLVIGTTAGGHWSDGRIADPVLLTVLVVVLAALITVLLVAGAVVAPTARPGLATLCCALWCGVMFWCLRAGFSGWRQAGFAVLVALVAGAFLTESVLSNTGHLHDQGVDRATRVVALAVGVCAGATTTWMAGPALQSAGGVVTVGYALLHLAVAAAATVALPFLAAGCLPGARPARTQVIGLPLAGLLQDGFVVLVLVISVAGCPTSSSPTSTISAPPGERPSRTSRCCPPHTCG
ncbi:hypothetical protein Ani05nite_20340 [Amorphoplanes nipponensis]|uniref:Uncharacterized protein n=2 Tax=Actinoplanes nipponensis TaxID=135950 RepID=A0A919MSW9_9ACTN|nr:hypothetical protein Ani05nite_20340 [Actinoplanes nipponensis]